MISSIRRLLLGIDLAFVQVLGFGNHKRFPLLDFGVVAGTVERAQSVGMIGINQQRIEHGAQHAAVSPMLLQGRGDVVLQLLVGIFQLACQFDGNNIFPIRRKRVRDIFQRHEGTGVHQVLAEEQRRCSRLAPDGHLSLVLLGAGVVLDLGALNGLDHPELLGEAFLAGRAPGEAVPHHSFGIDPEQGVVEVVGIAAEKSAGQSGDSLCDSCQHAQSVALCRVAGELVHLVGDGVVEPLRACSGPCKSAGAMRWILLRSACQSGE